MFGSLLRNTSSIECELLKVRNSREERETGQPLTWLVIQSTPSALKSVCIFSILFPIHYLRC